MSVRSGIFSNASDFDVRFAPTYEKLEEWVRAARVLGHEIVLTSGSFDLVHIGHALYLEKAKSLGDVLVVGVDSDTKISRRKGSGRPIVPESERLQMLTHLRHVDLIALKGADDGKWELIRRVHPDVLVATEGNYTVEDIEQLTGEYCGRVEVLPRMAEGSTSARVRNLALDLAGSLAGPLIEAIVDLIQTNLPTVVAKAIERFTAAQDFEAATDKDALT